MNPQISQIAQMNSSKPDPRDPQTHEIIGAAMEVHRQLGHGFLEAVYQEALAIEFGFRGIDFHREVEFPITYKDRAINSRYKADYVCFNSVIVELKALARLTHVEQSQTLNYLRASGLERGLLLNFGSPSLEYQRLIFTKPQALTRGTRGIPPKVGRT